MRAPEEPADQTGLETSCTTPTTTWFLSSTYRSPRHLARYITRAPLRLDAITPLDAARLVVCTQPDPQTGSQRLELEVLEMIRRLCAQIPAPRQPLVTH